MSKPVIYPEEILDFTDQQDSIWFQNDINPVATIVYGDREASVFVVGEVRVRVGDFIYKNVNEIIDFGIHNDAQLDEAVKRGDIEFFNNNWFEVLEVGDDDVTGVIEHTLRGAIDAAVDYLVG
jgi:hypothetical protein